MEDENDLEKEYVLVYVSPPQKGDFDELVVQMIEDMSKDEYYDLISSSKTIVSGYPGYVVRYNTIDPYSGEIAYLHYFIKADNIWS